MASTPTRSEIELVHTAARRLLPTAPDGLAEALEAVDWGACAVEESGQFHRVLIMPGVAVLRMTRLSEAGAPASARYRPDNSPAAHLPRRMALVTALEDAGLPFALPLPYSRVHTVRRDDGAPLTASVLQRWLPGQAHPPHQGEAPVLRGIVQALADVDVHAPAIADALGPPEAFRGPWTARRVERVQSLAQVLDDDARSLLPADWPRLVREVLAVTAGWSTRPVVGGALVHGDLAGHNMRWSPSPADDDTATHWRLTGVLDWDLAHAGDPARNVAYLALWHGTELLEAIARDADEARRARLWLAHAALDSLDDARARLELTGAPVRFARLLRRCVPRVQAAHALLDGVGVSR